VRKQPEITVQSSSTSIWRPDLDHGWHPVYKARLRMGEKLADKTCA
jgi:hypothetical protein